MDHFRAMDLSPWREHKHPSLLIIIILIACIPSCTVKTPAPPIVEESFRIALFNIWEMSTTKIMDVDDQGVGVNEQLVAAAQIIADVNPDILVINEIDHDLDAVDSGAELALNLQRFQDAYLTHKFQYLYIAPCNTGILAGKDLDNNGMIASPNDSGTRDHGGDCYGYGGTGERLRSARCWNVCSQ